MSFDDGADDVPVEMPDVSEFVVPTPAKKPLFSRGKPAGDKSDEKPPRARTTKPRIPNKKGQFVEPVLALYMGAGAMLMPFDPICGNGLVQAAPECAKYWDELAYQNDAVRRFLHGLTQTSLTTRLFMAHLPILMAVVMHHSPFAQHAMGAMGQRMAETIAEQMRGTPDGESSTDE